MIGALATAWKLSKGFRLHPWDSPYLKWRIETWSGVEASSITTRVFIRFVLEHRSELWRYLRWAGELRRTADASQ